MTAQQQPNTAGIADDYGADLKQFQTDGGTGGLRQFGVFQGSPAEGLDQRIGQRRQQQTELVRPPQAAAGSVGKQIQLLLFNPVFHLASGTVDLFVKRLRLAGQIGHDIARVAALAHMFGFEDDPAPASPGSGFIVQIGKHALFLLCCFILCPGLLNPELAQTLQTPVFGQADDIANVLALAPVQHPVPTKAAVAAEGDLNVRPSLAQALDQQGQNRPAMLGSVYVTGA